MDAYCPRCKEAIPQVDHTILQKGKCPTCGGQISVGGVTSDLPLDGAIAMSFAVGSRVAVPLDAAFEQTELDIDGGRGMFDSDRPTEDTQPRAKMPQPPPPPPDAVGGDQLPAHMQDASPPPPGTLEDEPTVRDVGPPAHAVNTRPTVPGLDPAALAATMDVPRSFHEQETVVAPSPDDNDDHADEPDADLPAPPSTDDLPAHLAAAGGDFSMESPESDATPDPVEEEPSEAPSAEAPPADEPPADEPAADEPPADEPAADQPSAEAAAAAEEPAPGGAHLQLPSIDFSMPDLGAASPAGAPPATDPLATAAPPTGDLPAHLQLPNFPDFELPPIPGEEKEKITGDIEISHAGTGSFGAIEDGGEPTVPDGAPGADNWSVADATQPSVPPPLPAPPPLPPGRPEPQPQAQAPTPQSAEDLPSLPGLGLPSLGTTESNVPKEPTLVQSDVAARVAQAERKSRMPLMIVGVLLFLLAGIGGTVAYYGPATVASWFGGDKPAKVVATKRDKAEELNYAGEQAYREGTEAEKSGKKKPAQAKYKAAIKKFRSALSIDATFGKAHRNLAIALAKSNKQKEAVEQYRAYLKKEPDAPDKKAVLKIINDYEKSQQKKKK